MPKNANWPIPIHAERIDGRTAVDRNRLVGNHQTAATFCIRLKCLELTIRQVVVIGFEIDDLELPQRISRLRKPPVEQGDERALRAGQPVVDRATTHRPDVRQRVAPPSGEEDRRRGDRLPGVEQIGVSLEERTVLGLNLLTRRHATPAAERRHLGHGQFGHVLPPRAASLVAQEDRSGLHVLGEQ